MIKLKKMSGIQILAKLIQYTWQASPVTFILLILTSVVMSGLGFLEILTIESLFDGAIAVANGAAAAVMYKSVLMLLIILAVTPVSEWLEYLARGYFWRRGSGYMKAQHHLRIHKMKSIEFEDSNNMDELQKASLGGEDAPTGLRVIIQVLFLYLPYILILLVYLISIKPILAAAIVLIFMPTLLLERIRMRQNFNFEDKIANQRRKTKYFESCIVSKEYFKEALLNGSFPFFFRLFKESNAEFSKAFIAVKKSIFKTSVLMKLLHAAGFMSVLILLVYFVYDGTISMGLFAAIYYSISKITTMLKRAIDDLGEALVGISNTSFLVRLLEEEDDPGRKEDIRKDQDIHLKEVCFTYPKTNKETLKNINLTINAGTSLAIVGENGSGKSTLTKIIMGLYDPTRGVVTYGKEPLKHYSDSSRFSRTSAVFQDFIKYKLPAEDNIKISKLTSKASIKDSLEKADVSFSDLGIHSDTILSREFGGQELSGGEWQRIAIARGLYRPHDLIVLDEPTAAIDPMEEANVFDSFRRISTGKTCIFVTHRLGSTQIADRIIVMVKGEVAEEGTHKELMDLKGKYYHLLKSQAQWYKR